MRLKLPRAALLDWDNTLVDSFAVIHKAYDETFRAMGLPTWTYEETCARVARSMRESFPELFGERWREARDLYRGAYAAHHLDHVRPLPGADDLLAVLAEAGVYLAVVSNKTGEYLRAEVDHLGWRGYFGRVVGAADAAEDKPAAAPVALALQGSGVAPGKDVWFVGDNVIDVACAEAAGCVPVIVRGAVETGDEAALAAVRWRFDGCTELAAVVREF
ncbi:MAG: HAD family hydrolase [Alphaproteobacteria bacterium]